MRKPCLIKKALRLRYYRAWVIDPCPRLWENLAWLRRHYDQWSLSNAVSVPLYTVRKPCLIKKALRLHFFASKGLKLSMSVRKPCLIKKALRRDRERVPDISLCSPRVRKPCLIKKALRRKRLFFFISLSGSSSWENLAWLRRHYDDTDTNFKKFIRLDSEWENLAWLRRHYDRYRAYRKSYRRMD